MIKKLLCKIGCHCWTYHHEIDITKFDIKSKHVKEDCECKFWKCRWCDLKKAIK